MFYKSKDFKVGLKVEVNEEPCVIIDLEFVNPGKGQAFNRLKLKSFLSGLILRKTVKLGEKLKAADLYEVKCRYLYSSTDLFHFIDDESLESYEIAVSLIGDSKYWLKEGFLCNIIFWNNVAISLKPPKFVELLVISSEDVSSSSIISKSFKNSILETGISVKVPLFVKSGDIIKVDTENIEYISRVS